MRGLRNRMRMKCGPFPIRSAARFFLVRFFRFFSIKNWAETIYLSKKRVVPKIHLINTPMKNPLVSLFATGCLALLLVPLCPAQDDVEGDVQTLLGAKKFKTRGAEKEDKPTEVREVFVTRGIPTNIAVAEEEGLVKVEKTGNSGVAKISVPVDASSKLTNRSIQFKVNSTEFADAASFAELERLTKIFQDSRLGEYRFIVEGHSSAEGGEEHNQSLSQRRADAIVAELVSRGVSKSLLVSLGFGEAKANFPDSAPEYELAQDRRVEIFRITK